MASSRIASRYSKSLIELASDSNSLDAVKADMVSVEETCSSSKELSNLLNNPIVKPEDKKAVLSKVFSGLNKLSLDFVLFLVDKRRESELPLVANQFIQAYDQLKGISRATVISAIPLSQDTLSKVKSYIQGLVGSGDLELSNEIDPSIIGGMVIKHEDRLLDMSVAKELREIRKEIIFN